MNKLTTLLTFFENFCRNTLMCKQRGSKATVCLYSNLFLLTKIFRGPLLLIVLFSAMLNAQNNDYVQYVVKKGDTLYGLSQKYGVTVDHILKHNSYLKFEYLGIGDVLRFPSSTNATTTNVGYKLDEYDPYESASAYETDLVRHIVTDNETLYALSKKYNIPVKSILAHNPNINQSVIRVSDVIFVPLNVSVEETVGREPSTQEGRFSHVVDLGETLYGISRRYGISIEELIAMNPSLNTRIGIGDTLLLDGRKSPPVMVNVPSTVRPSGDPIIENNLKNPYLEPGDILHMVQPKETLYGLSRKYKVEIAQLVRWNGLTDKALPVGYELIVAKADMPNLPNVVVGDENVRVYDPRDEVREVQVIVEPTTREIEIIDADEYLDNPNAHLHDHGDLRHSHAGAHQPHSHEGLEFESEGETWFDQEDEEEIVETKQPANPEEYSTIHEVDYSKLKSIQHKVSRGESFEMIAAQYNQNIELMREWNKIDDIYAPLPPELIVGWYIPKERPSSVRPVLSVSQQEQEFRAKYDKFNRNQLAYKRVKERGQGTWLRDDASLDKNFYCLHRTAPLKSVIRVLNPMNDKVVYAKVVGRPPADGRDGDVDIKLTFAAVKKLNLLDEKFVLDWSYHVPKGRKK